jgi:hypothetical protein
MTRHDQLPSHRASHAHAPDEVVSLTAGEIVAALRRQPDRRMLQAEHPGLSNEIIEQALRMAATGRRDESIELHVRA